MEYYEPIDDFERWFKKHSPRTYLIYKDYSKHERLPVLYQLIKDAYYAKSEVRNKKIKPTPMPSNGTPIKDVSFGHKETVFIYSLLLTMLIVCVISWIIALLFFI